MQIRRVLVLFLYCFTVLLTAVKGYNDDKIESTDPKFRAMLRYGRSSRTSNNEKANAVKVAPRAGAFFFGPRYGKRSASLTLADPDPSENGKRLACSWIGLSNLYRCTRSSATLYIDGGGDITGLKRHGGWKSTQVAEGYIDQSMRNKTTTADTIAKQINSNEATSSFTATEIQKNSC